MTGNDGDNKPTNPKDLIGSNKLPLHLWPPVATALGSLALLDGALRYGRSNFRAVGVRASIYHDALMRHVDAWFEGEDNDPASGVPHLGHALACLAILVDAQAARKLNDDRRYPGGHREAVDELTAHVARLRDLHAGSAPTHYTIEGALPPAPKFEPGKPGNPFRIKLTAGEGPKSWYDDRSDTWRYDAPPKGWNTVRWRDG